MYELQRKIKLKTTLAFFSLFTTWTPSYFPVYTRYVKVQPNYVINLFPIRYYDHQKLRDFVNLYILVYEVRQYFFRYLFPLKKQTFFFN